MKIIYIINRLILILILPLLLTSCITDESKGEDIPARAFSEEEELEPDSSEIELELNGNPIMPIDEQVNFFEEDYASKIPNSWGENVDGVKRKIRTDDKVIALTFDACGGESDGYDEEIIQFLIDENIAATLFINSRWIDKFPEVFSDLADNPLFEIGNHGYYHKPLSVTGESAYGIRGTENIKEVVEEILLNDKKILELTGQKPRYFRSGTAYYDEIAVEIASELDYNVVNYNVLGDAGASFSKEEIISASNSATAGSIILFHMNRPETNIAQGIIEGITQLQDRGYSFVKLSDYHNLLE